MKKLFLLTIMALFAFVLNAQIEMSANNLSKNIIYKTIPKKLHIQDKIIIKNKSPYYLLQMVVAIPKENGDLEPLGFASQIAPNMTFTMANFKNNSLKKLRGKTIAIKAKGEKFYVNEHNGPSIALSNESSSIESKEIDPETSNNLKEENVTYNFDVNLYEDWHDLYIEIYSSGENGKGVMDF